jgi:hypothetical protein
MASLGVVVVYFVINAPRPLRHGDRDRRRAARACSISTPSLSWIDRRTGQIPFDPLHGDRSVTQCLR